jgi:branched-chain amino acid transport system ATP-binding protein
MTAATLEVRHLSLSFGPFKALTDVNFKVSAGGVHAFIGPNGAGKTSLFNCISGALLPDSGQVLLGGEDIARMSAQRRVHRGLARSFQVTNIFPEVSVLENVRLCVQALRGGTGYNPFPAKRAQEAMRADALQVLAQLGLDRHRDQLAGNLPHGLQRRLEVAMAVAARPSVLLLDEPTSGMGVDDLQGMTQLIGELGKTCTVILIEHNIKLVMAISEDVTVLHRGTVLTSGNPEAVANHPEVKNAYLGKRHG